MGPALPRGELILTYLRAMTTSQQVTFSVPAGLASPGNGGGAGHK